ncbi:MAG: Gfo/Idh/MocA family oxidoreductase [Tepidisphaeraceae bacterium]
MTVSTAELAIGIVGAGSFAGFASKAFVQVPGVKVVAVADTNSTSAQHLARELSAKAYSDYESLLRDIRISLVYISTPPYLHYSQSKAALTAGKHVICEKPAALKTAEAEELASLAASKRLLYVVNLMQRYNPLFSIVRDIVNEKILGAFLHGFFENYASDENLKQDHWFWDEEKSGGIFIEHAVHFFDLFSGWLGKGEIIHAAQWQRPGTNRRMNDRVQSTVNYPLGPVTFYHGFDQPRILDRQEMRLQFERGDISLFEWVPVKLRLHGLLEKEQLEKLKTMMPDCSITQNGYLPDEKQRVTGRFHEFVFDQHVTVEYGKSDEKEKRYRQLLMLMIRDQWNWILDNSVVRVVDDRNAIESLRIAEKAANAATRL